MVVGAQHGRDGVRGVYRVGFDRGVAICYTAGVRYAAKRVSERLRVRREWNRVQRD
jgi:hypothetical protein